MQARIYRPAKSAMQSGPRGLGKDWVLEFERAKKQVADNLMGWLGSDDTGPQVRLRFQTREEAIAYAEREGLDYRVAPEPQKSYKPKNYADNFRYDKLEFGRF